jgi:capsular exopolysaccharide synthesis family protein
MMKASCQKQHTEVGAQALGESVRWGDRIEPSVEDMESPRKIDEHEVSLLAPTSYEAEQYRTLRLYAELMRKDSGMQVLAVTSPTAGDGKTTTSINLAGALAQSPDARVLLVCLDLRKPSIAEALGIRQTPLVGLVNAILDPDLALSSVVHQFPQFNLSVLPAGSCPDEPYELLKSPRLGELLQEARQHFDYTVLDTPPLLLVPDCRIVGRWVDGFLLVVTAHRTPRKLVEESLNLLSPDKLLGLVFNQDDQSLPGYYGYGYYQSAGRSSDPGQVRWWRRLPAAVRRIVSGP